MGGSTLTVPELGLVVPAMMRSIVVLPEPFSPITPIASPVAYREADVGERGLVRQAPCDPQQPPGPLAPPAEQRKALADPVQLDQRSWRLCWCWLAPRPRAEE